MASLPISTTQALFGGLVGAGLVHDAGGVQFAKAAAIIVVPLLLSPLMAAVLALVVAPLLRRTAHAPAASRVARSDGPIESLATPPLRSLRGIDLLHVLSAAVVLVAAGLGGVAGASSSVVIAMAIGGWLGAHRVAKTLAWRVTAMDPREGLAGNLVTSTLVIAASRFGLPVSTTHVSTGALFGIGLSNGKANFRIIAMILLAWGVTLPTSAMIAALLHFLLPSV
jgi:PiT family inorganic phosphate transporter